MRQSSPIWNLGPRGRAGGRPKARTEDLVTTSDLKTANISKFRLSLRRSNTFWASMGQIQLLSPYVIVISVEMLVNSDLIP